MPVMIKSELSPACATAPRKRAPKATESSSKQQVEHVAPGSSSGLLRTRPLQLAERDDRTGERHRADEDADEDLDGVDRAFGVRRVGGRAQVAARCRPAPPPGRRSCAASRPAPASRSSRRATASSAPIAPPTASAHGERAVAVHVTARGDAERQQHADDAEDVAAPCGLLRAEAGQAEDEQHAGDEIGDA